MAFEQAPKWSGVKEKIGKRNKPSVALERKKAGGTNRLCFDAAHLRYQILLSVDLIGHIADC